MTIGSSRVNGLPEIVVSRTLDKAEWEDGVADELAKLKQEPGCRDAL